MPVFKEEVCKYAKERLYFALEMSVFTYTNTTKALVKLSCLLITDRHFLLLPDKRSVSVSLCPFSHYNQLSLCSEKCAAMIHCYYPNVVVQELFVDIHKQYFNLCDTKEDALPDAPARVVLVLTLLPVSVIPILVYMVIWKSSVID